MPDEVKKEKIEPVISQTHLAKRSPNRAMRTMFPESLKSVGGYILRDIIVPAVKNLLDDTISKGTHALLWGNNAAPQRNRTREDSVSYERYYTKASSSKKPSNSSTLSSKYSNHSVYDYADVEFETKAEADKVLSHMRAAVSRYKVCSVRDMYDYAGTVDSEGHVVGRPVDARYGWYNLDDDNIGVAMYGGKWYLNLPKAVPLDDD